MLEILRETRLATCITAAAVLAVAGYAVWPIQRTAVPSPDLSALTQTGPRISPPADQPPFTADVFNATIWVDPPAPPAPTIATRIEPAAPVHLQLIGIVTEPVPDGTPSRLAAIYDAGEDRLHIVANGETVERFSVIEIGVLAVRVTDGRREWELALETPGEAP